MPTHCHKSANWAVTDAFISKDSRHCHTVARCFLTKINRNVFNRLSALENSSPIADHTSTTIYLHFNAKGVAFEFHCRNIH